jgi:extracellular matrix regulatory protein A
MDSRLVNIGFGNAVTVSRILAVVHPGSSPIRKLKEDARSEKKLIDVTEGRRTRAIVILDTGHLVLSSVQPETISQRLLALDHDQRNPSSLLEKGKREEQDG